LDEQKLKDMSCSLNQRARELILHGDREAALQVVEESLAGKKGFHDFAVKWANLLLAYIGDKLGDDAVLEVHEQFAQVFRPPVIKQWEAAGADPDAFPLEEFIEQRTSMWHGHDNEFTWEEDEDKYILTLTPCESGGRLNEWLDGNRAARMKGKEPYAYNQEGFSYYCLHCPTMWELGWIKQYGYPLIIFFPPQETGEPCVQHFYKHPRLIPDEYYQRLGIERRI